MNPSSLLTASSPSFRKSLNVRTRPRLRRVINATGVVIHTNLGRSPLHPSALQHLIEISRTYSNLEYDLDRGERGSRYSHVEEILCRLSGAESAMVVNNNAGRGPARFKHPCRRKRGHRLEGRVGRNRGSLSDPGCDEAERGPAQGGRNDQPDPPQRLSEGDWTSDGIAPEGPYQQFQGVGFYLGRFPPGTGSTGERASDSL